MRIAFLDFVNWDYHAGSPREIPLGGSQSALCHLSQELAARGSRVQLLVSGARRERYSHGVHTLPLEPALAAALQSAEAVIVLNAAKPGPQLRSAIGPDVPLILWTQHAHDQPAMRPLLRPEVRDAFDGFALVSDWQSDMYRREFGLPASRCRVLRNAPGPAFSGMFQDAERALAAKAGPPVLAYASTPFRGLHLLLRAFPQLRAVCPGLRLKVFSSMRVYQVAASEDRAQYGDLYRACQEMEGVEYIGSAPQSELARQFASVRMLAYANNFAETSCIAVMEALAAGCRVVTSDLGALRETCNGFARLIPPPGDEAVYCAAFVAAVVDELKASEDLKSALPRLTAQLAAVRESCTWPQRAAQWDGWLTEVRG